MKAIVDKHIAACLVELRAQVEREFAEAIQGLTRGVEKPRRAVVPQERARRRKAPTSAPKAKDRATGTAGVSKRTRGCSPRGRLLWLRRGGRVLRFAPHPAALRRHRRLLQDRRVSRRSVHHRRPARAVQADRGGSLAMGPTYLVLLVEGVPGAGSKTTLVYLGDDEAKARELYDYARTRGLAGCSVYLVTVRAEARLS